MSHNVTLRGISIEDMDVLERALEELNEEYDTQFSLRVGEVAGRNYRGSRLIPGTVAVIVNGGMSYDITLTADADGRVSMQTESMVINALIEKFELDPQLTLDISTGEACDLRNVGYGSSEQLGMQAALGKIIQRYAVLVAEDAASQQGHRTTREYDPQTGVLNLIAEVG